MADGRKSSAGPRIGSLPMVRRHPHTRVDIESVRNTIEVRDDHRIPQAVERPCVMASATTFDQHIVPFIEIRVTSMSPIAKMQSCCRT